MTGVKFRVFQTITDAVTFLNTVEVTELVSFIPADNCSFIVIYK